MTYLLQQYGTLGILILCLLGLAFSCYVCAATVERTKMAATKQMRTDWFASMASPDNQWHYMHETPDPARRLVFRKNKNGELHQWKYDAPSLP